MAGIDEETLIAAVADWQLNEVRILEPGATTRQLIPEAWWPVAESTDPDERKHAALDLWNEDFLALIPHYAHALQTALVDVRVAKHKYYSAPSLDYVLRTDEGELRVWAGDDPRTFGDIDPPLFDAVQHQYKHFCAKFTPATPHPTAKPTDWLRRPAWSPSRHAGFRHPTPTRSSSGSRTFRSPVPSDCYS